MNNGLERIWKEAVADPRQRHYRCTHIHGHTAFTTDPELQLCDAPSVPEILLAKSQGSII
jgi:hypothetical protein